MSRASDLYNARHKKKQEETSEENAASSSSSATKSRATELYEQRQAAAGKKTSASATTSAGTRSRAREIYEARQARAQREAAREAKYKAYDAAREVKLANDPDYQAKHQQRLISNAARDQFVAASKDVMGRLMKGEKLTDIQKSYAEQRQAADLYYRYAGEYSKLTPEQQANEARKLYSTKYGAKKAFDEAYGSYETGKNAATIDANGDGRIDERDLREKARASADASDRYKWLVYFGDEKALEDERKRYATDAYLEEQKAKYERNKRELARMDYEDKRRNAENPISPTSRAAKADAEKEGNEQETYRRLIDNIEGRADWESDTEPRNGRYDPVEVHEQAEEAENRQARRDELEANANRYKRLVAPLENARSYYGREDFEKNSEAGDILNPQERYDKFMADPDTQTSFALSADTASGPNSTNYERLYKADTWKQLTDDEKKVWYYIYRTEGDAAAAQYLDTMRDIADQRLMQDSADYVAQAGALERIFLNIASVPMSVFGAPYALIETAAEGLTGEYHPYKNTWSNQAQAIREGTSRDWHPVGQFFYNAGMSAADSMLGAFTLGKNYTYAMGMGAAEKRAQELWEEGASPAQIVVGAGLDGIAEALFEEVSIEKLLSKKALAGFKGWLKASLVQAGTEASEEAATGVANLFNDIVVRGNMSEFAQTYRRYLSENGGDEMNALWRTIGDNVQEIGLEAAAGAVSGGFSGGAFNLANIDSVATAEARVHNTADAIRQIREFEFNRANAQMQGKLTAEADQAISAAEQRLYDKYNLEAYDVEVTPEGAMDAAEYFAETASEEVANDVERTLADFRSGEYLTTESGETEYVADNGSEAEAVNIDRIVRGENGEKLFELADGRTVSPKNVTFGTAREAAVYGVLTDAKAVDARDADEIAKAVLASEAESAEGSESVDAAAMTAAAVSAYNYGRLGLGYADAVKTDLAQNANATILQRAYDLGEARGNERYAAEQGNVDEGKLTYTRKGEGRVIFDDAITAEDNTTLIDRGHAVTVEGLEYLAKALGVNIHLVKSAKNANGERVGDNGWYDPATGDIYIDIYAGERGNSLIMFTAAHELTHFIRQNSPAQFRALANFLVSVYGKHNQSVTDLVNGQIAKARDNGRTLDTEEAFEEFVADSMESMLEDGEVIRRLAVENPGLLKRIGDLLQSFVDRLRKLYQGLTPDSEEGQLVRGWIDEANQLREMFAAALSSAREGYAKAGVGEAEGTFADASTGEDVKKTKKSSRSRVTSQEDADYLAAVERGDMETAQRMVDEAAERWGALTDDDEEPIQLYHQTGAVFTSFDVGHDGAGRRDNETPRGIFLKTSPDDIGVKGDIQMPLYARMTKALTATDRSDLVRQLEKIVPGYAEIKSRIASLDAEYQSKVNEAREAWRKGITEWRNSHPDADRRSAWDDSAISELFDEEERLIDEWTEKATALDVEAKDLLTRGLIEAGYDGIILSHDKGSFGRSTDAYIVLDNKNVKLSDPVTYDRGNVIPLSERFNEEKSDIRYSSRGRTQAQRDSEATAKEIRERFGLTMKTGDIAERLAALYERIGTEMKADDPDRAALDEEVRKVVSEIDEVREITPERSEYAQTVLNAVRGTKIYLDQTMVGEIKSSFGSLRNFTKRFFGDKVTFTSDRGAGTALDVQWREWASQFPGTFDAEESSMPSRLLEIVEAMKNDTEQTYELDHDAIDADLESAIWEGYREYEAQRSSNRAILSEALASAAQTPEERTNIQRYRSSVDEINRAEARLKEVNAEISELSVAKGPRDTARINELKEEKAKLTKQIDAADSRLLKLEASQPLKDYVARVRENTKQTLNAEYITREANLRAEMEAEIERVRLEERWKGAEKNHELRKQRDAAIEAVREKYRERISELRSNRRAADVRQKLGRLESRLRQRLLRPAENKYVTNKMIAPVADLLTLLGRYNGKSDNVAEQARALLKAYEDARVRAALEQDTLPTKMTTEDEEGHTVSVDHDPVKLALEELADIFGEGRSVRDLTEDELTKVYTIARMIEHLVATETKTISTKKALSINALRNKALRETRGAKDVSKYVLRSVRPRTAFEIFGGFVKNGAWVQIYDMLNEADLKRGDIVMELSKVFENLMPGDRGSVKNHERVSQKVFDAFINPDNAVDIGLVDEDGKAYLVTHDMLVMLALTLDHPDNFAYVVKNGLSAPDKERYYKGKLADAYTGKGWKKIVPPHFEERNKMYEERASLREQLDGIKDEERRQEIADRIETLDKQIEENLEEARKWAENIKSKITDVWDDYDQRWYYTWRRFAEKSQEKLNEATRLMYGFDRANVKDYFPIRTDSRFGALTFESLVHDFTVEGAGFMKERVGTGVRPLYLEGVSYVARDHIGKVAQYAAMAPALRDFSKIVGKSTMVEGKVDSLTAALDTVFDHKKGTRWLENLTADMNGARKKESVSFLQRIRSKYAGAVLTLNPSVTFAQVASAPTAASVYGGKAVAKAFGLHGLPVAGRADDQLIAKWTSILYNRNYGVSEREAGGQAGGRSALDAAQDKLGFLFKWINAADNYTVNRLWWASEYYVQENSPELKVGSDEYYMAVAEMFERGIQETQPSYGVLQRPDILRDPNELVRSLTMFMTQRLQNFSIMYESIGRYRKYREDYKNKANGVTAEDVSEAATGIKRATVSLLIAGAMIVAFKTLAAFALYRVDSWRDEDEELTPESISLHIADMFLDTTISNFLGGSELYSLLGLARQKLFGAKTYNDPLFEVNSVAQVNDFVDNITKLVTSFTTPLDENGELNAGDWAKIGLQFKRSATKVIETVTGLPVNNAGKIADGVVKWTKDVIEGTVGKFEQRVERTQTQQARRIVKAYLAGENEKVETVKAELGDEKTAKSAVKKYIAKQYRKNKMKREDVENILDDVVGMDDDEIFWWFDEQDAAREGDGDSGKYDDFIEAVSTGKDLKKTIKKYLDNGVGAKTLARAITDNFKPLYLEASTGERASMKGRLLNAYVALGYVRTKKANDIDEWLKQGGD